jgi:hypothetical protein
MTGFSFVDQINANKRAEARLEDRLAREQEERQFQRTRTEESDEQVRENRRIAAEDRKRILGQEERFRAATRLSQDVPGNFEALQEFSDIPDVANKLALERQSRQLRADLEALRGSGASPEEIAAAEEEAAQQKAGLAAQIQAAEVPGPQFAEQPELSKSELNTLAITDPEQAMQIRDEQAAQRPPVQFDPAARSFSGELEAAAAEERQAARTREGKTEQVNNQWRAATDISDTSGDELRTLDPELSTALYFDDRNTLTEDVRRDADKFMAPKVIDTIKTQTATLATAEPGSKEARNAGRKLGEALGLKQEMHLDYSPTKNAGVNRGGVPVGTAPARMREGIEEEARSGILPAYPTSQEQQRVDETVLKRGATKRINEKQAAAAYRFYSGGRWTLNQYNQYMDTGKWPPGAVEFKAFSREDDVWAFGPNGQAVVVRQGRGKPGEGRDVIGKEALAQLNKHAKAYDSARGDTSGTDAVRGFLSGLGQNAGAFAEADVDLQNPASIFQLFDRHMDQFVIRSKLGDEWLFNGDWNPDFAQRYGSFAQALLGTGPHSIDADFGREGLEEIEAELPSGALTPLPAGLRQDINYEAITAPDGPMPGASRAQVDAAIAEQGL